MKILFLDDCNGHEFNNPFATIIQIEKQISHQELYETECKQHGALRIGGDWTKIMSDLNIPYSILQQGKRSDIKCDVDVVYKVISGNY